jgi:hypothetical protein
MTLLMRALSSKEIKDLASHGPDAPGIKEAALLYGGTPVAGTAITDSARWTNSPRMTAEAWINPSADNPGSRILHKITPGKDDGFLLDTHPGNSLRLIVGGISYLISNCLNSERIAGRGGVSDQVQRIALDRGLRPSEG